MSYPDPLELRRKYISNKNRYRNRATYLARVLDHFSCSCFAGRSDDVLDSDIAGSGQSHAR